jgi:hypothetical protein
MGALEPIAHSTSHELGLIIEATADSQADANGICSFARSSLLHYGYPGRISTAGNLAFPYSPSDVEVGKVYRFNIYHIIDIADPLELFTITFHEGGQVL